VATDPQVVWAFFLVSFVSPGPLFAWAPSRFLKAGVYLVLEKLELHVFRRLIRKM